MIHIYFSIWYSRLFCCCSPDSCNNLSVLWMQPVDHATHTYIHSVLFMSDAFQCTIIKMSLLPLAFSRQQNVVDWRVVFMPHACTILVKWNNNKWTFWLVHRYFTFIRIVIRLQWFQGNQITIDMLQKNAFFLLIFQNSQRSEHYWLICFSFEHCNGLLLLFSLLF